MANPIPWNPERMAIGHAKQCLGVLRHAFEQLDRDDITPSQIVHYLRQERDIQLAQRGSAD